jgi:hypothetical protein
LDCQRASKLPEIVEIWQAIGAELVKTITTGVIVIVSGKVAGYGEVFQANQRNPPSS